MVGVSSQNEKPEKMKKTLFNLILIILYLIYLYYGILLSATPYNWQAQYDVFRYRTRTVKSARIFLFLIIELFIFLSTSFLIIRSLNNTSCELDKRRRDIDHSGRSSGDVSQESGRQT